MTAWRPGHRGVARETTADAEARRQRAAASAGLKPPTIAQPSRSPARHAAVASTSRTLLLALALAMAPLLNGCLDFDGAYDEVARRLDAGTTDAGTTDAGTTDAGATDAGGTDAGATDAGETDAGETDAGTTDAGTTDAGTTDAGTTDAGTSDAGESDAGPGDAGASDAGAVDGGGDAGAQCGPWRLQARSVFLDDAGLTEYIGASASAGRLLIAGVDPLAEGTARQLPGGPAVSLPFGPVTAMGRDGLEFFMTDFGGGGWFRLDAGYTSAMTGPCNSDFAGAVYSPAPGTAVFCDEETLAICLLSNGTPSRLAPGPAVPGRLTCSAVTFTADGGLLRGGAIRPDAGGGNSEALLVGADGTVVPFPSGEFGLSALVALDAETPFVINALGEVLARRDGGWVRGPVRDGGSFRALVPFTGPVVLALGARNAVAWFDGQRFCETSIDGLAPGWTWNWIDALRVGDEIVATGAASPDGGPSRGVAAILEFAPW